MASGPTEVLPDVWHWRTSHPRSSFEVDSYWLAESGVMLDPLVPPEGLSWFEGHATAPCAIVLSCRHHWRASAEYQEQFGIGPALVPEAGMHEFSGGERRVEPYAPGDTLPGGLVVHEIGSLAPDDMALVLPEAEAVFFADGLVVGSDGSLGFVPDGLMDDPPETKRGLLAAFSRLLEAVEFRHVLCAHGGPVVGDGRSRLEELVRVGGRTVDL